MPNSTVWPGCSSTAARSLMVSSDDDLPSGVFAADEEEDDITTYHRRRRAVCLTRARSPMNRSKEGRRAGEQLQNARVLRRTGHDASGSPQSNSTTSVNGHIKNPRRTTSREGSVSTI
jgi:hypothetical protein